MIACECKEIPGAFRDNDGSYVCTGCGRPIITDPEKVKS